MCMYAYIIRVRSIMSNAADIDTKQNLWSTWEELLLAFAVKRHGLKDWDTVAMELQNRHHRGSLASTLFTAQICKDKYRSLRKRFTNHRYNSTARGGGGGGGGGGSENNESAHDVQSDDDENDVGGGDEDDGGGDSLPWLEELRKLRVAELKQEVHHRDLSIRSLQRKVKTMEEEREQSLKEEDQNDDVNQPDLDEEVKKERSDNDKNDDKDAAEEVAGKSVSGDADNMSFNESNSTGNRREGMKTEPAEVKPESELKPVGGEDSCNDSSDRHEVAGKANQERVDSGELRDSVDESKEGTKESSDVQSSASLLLRGKRKRRGEFGGGGGEGMAVSSAATVPLKRERNDTAKLESASGGFGVLDKIRAHKRGSVFQRRLESQKTENYKNTIRRHVDLETVQARVDDGSYSSCYTKFYVDLLLLFTNAIVFFPKSSRESLAAEELRDLVMKEVKKKTSSDPSAEPENVPVPVKPKPEYELQRSDSLLAKNKSTAPIIFSRKRSSISAKASSSSANKVVDDKSVAGGLKPLNKSPLSTSNEEEDSTKLKIKEKPVTGVRSMRRSTKGRSNISKLESTPNISNSKSSTFKQPSSKDRGDKVAEALKTTDKKKSETTANNKKSGAADFLKRIKKNSPTKGTPVESLKSSRDSSSKGGKKDPQKKKVDKKNDGLVRRSNAGSGGGGRKHAKEESSPSSKRSTRIQVKKGKDVVASGGKRGREGGGEGEGSSKRPKKRSR